MMHETGESMGPNKDPKKNDIKMCRVSDFLISFFLQSAQIMGEPKKKLYFSFQDGGKKLGTLT